MDIQQILAACDHTLLSQTATVKQIHDLCDDGIAFGCASVCVPSCYTAEAKRYTGGRIPVCTVIGFPNGNSTTASKVFETANAVENGADEIDMVINVGMVKDCRWDDILGEIRAVKRACSGRLLKVIIEICFLTEDEIVKLCGIVAESGAEYIKTSTGFGGGGATFRAVELMRANCPDTLKIKAAGGISSLEDAERFLSLGASRLGTSRIVKIAKQMKEEN